MCIKYNLPAVGLVLSVIRDDLRVECDSSAGSHSSESESGEEKSSRIRFN